MWSNDSRIRGKTIMGHPEPVMFRRHYAHVRANMRKALGKIRNGTFAKQFIREMESGKKRYNALLRAAQKHPIENVGRKLRARMRWEKKN